MSTPSLTVLHLENYTSDAKRLFAMSQAWADGLRHQWVTPLHLLGKLVELRASALAAAGVDVKTVLLRVDEALAAQKTTATNSSLDGVTVRALSRAEASALREGRSVDIEHVFAAMCLESPDAAALAASAGITNAKLATPVTTGAGGAASYASEAAYLADGRQALRALAKRTRGALGVSEDLLLRQRVVRLLDLVSLDVGSAEGIPELRLIRESETRLVAARSGVATRIVVDWRAPWESLALDTEPAAEATPPLSFRWDERAHAWLTAGDPRMHFVEAFVSRLSRLYPELEVARPAPSAVLGSKEQRSEKTEGVVASFSPERASGTVRTAEGVDVSFSIDVWNLGSWFPTKRASDEAARMGTPSPTLPREGEPVAVEWRTTPRGNVARFVQPTARTTTTVPVYTLGTWLTALRKKGKLAGVTASTLRKTLETALGADVEAWEDGEEKDAADFAHLLMDLAALADKDASWRHRLEWVHADDHRWDRDEGRARFATMLGLAPSSLPEPDESGADESLPEYAAKCNGVAERFGLALRLHEVDLGGADAHLFVAFTPGDFAALTKKGYLDAVE